MQEYELIYRFFERTLIHERRYVYTGQSEHSFAFSYFDAATHHYFENQLANIRHFGLPEPKSGSFVIRDFGLNRIGIYMDDLYLCANCGCFYFEEEAPYIFDLIRTDARPFRRIMKALIAARDANSEFTVKPCSRSAECAERRSRQDRHREREALITVLQTDRPAPPKSVYLLRTSEAYKIGIAVDVSARIKALQSACPSSISLVKSWTPVDARACERLLHTRFGKYRVNGEWFNLPASELDWLTNLEDLPTVEPSR